MLKKKLWRTIGHYRAQFISMIIMIALGVGVFIGFNMEWYSIEVDTNYLYDETNLADYRLYNETGFSLADYSKISSIEGIDKATRFLSANTTVKGSTDVININVSENMTVTSFMLIGEGTEYDANSIDSFWVSDKYAEANDLAVGDSLTVIYESFEITGKIAGLIKTGEYMICVQDETQVIPDFDTYGYAFISPKMLESLLGMGFYTQINVISDLDKEEISELVDTALNRTTLIVGKEDNMSYSGSTGEIDEGKTMGSILPVLFLAIALLTMITTMHRLVINEKQQIGILKALGFKDRKIIMHYTSFALFIGIIGSVLGIGIGFALGYYIFNPNGAMGSYMDLPDWSLHMPWFGYVVLVLVVVLLAFIGFISVKKMLHGTAADALRPYSPKKMKQLPFERTKLFRKLSFGSKWNLRDVLRHKSRSLMTLIGVMGCMVLMVGALGMNDTIKSFVNVFYEDSLSYENRINMATIATNADALALCDEYSGDWSAQASVQINEEAYALEIYHIDNDLITFVSSNMKTISLEDDGAYVCSRIAKEYDLKVGDELVFSPYGSSLTYTVTVKAVTKSLSEGIVITDKYAEAIDYEYKINYVYTKSNDIALTSAISSVQSKSTIVDSFMSFMEIMNTMVFLLVLAAIVLGIVVLYNLGVMSYMERYREMATLKVVGFKNKRIASLLISQNIWITVLGMILGFPAGILTLKWLLVSLGSEYEMDIMLGPLTYIVSILVTFGVSFVVSVIVSRKNRYINMVEALKADE